MTEPPHSDKQVISDDNNYSDKQVVLSNNSIREYYKPEPNPFIEPRHDNDSHKEVVNVSSFNDSTPEAQSTLRRRICGLSPRTFYIIAVITIIAIGAAVGGGVVASTSNHKNHNSAANSSIGADGIQAGSTTTKAPISGTLSSATTSTTTKNPSLSSSPPSSTPTIGPITSAPSKTHGVALSTTTIVGASTTLLSDCPSSNNTLFTIDGASFRKACANDYLSNDENVVNTPAESLNDCIVLCNAYNVLNRAEIKSGNSNICNAVCWRSTIIGDDFPGQCFGFTTTNSSGAFVYAGGSNCNSAALINQSF